MRHGRWTATLAMLALAGTAGCGDDDGGSDPVPQAVEGDVIFRDALDDNRNGWLEVPQTPFRGGVYVWNEVPSGNVASAPDKLSGKSLPPGVAVSATVEQREGAALRMVACRENGEDGTRHHSAYQLGIDGRQALIRLWYEAGQPPKVLARETLDQPNDTPVTITGRCMPAGDGAVALSLLVDGEVAVETTHDEPLPNGEVGLHAGARADTDAPPSLAWDDFVVREVRANDGGDAGT
jgi:hypothetical protein